MGLKSLLTKMQCKLNGVSLDGVRFYMIFITAGAAVCSEERRDIQRGIMDSTF